MPPRKSARRAPTPAAESEDELLSQSNDQPVNQTKSSPRQSARSKRTPTPSKTSANDDANDDDDAEAEEAPPAKQSVKQPVRSKRSSNQMKKSSAQTNGQTHDEFGVEPSPKRARSARSTTPSTKQPVTQPMEQSEEEEEEAEPEESPVKPSPKRGRATAAAAKPAATQSKRTPVKQPASRTVSRSNTQPSTQPTDQSEQLAKLVDGFQSLKTSSRDQSIKLAKQAFAFLRSLKSSSQALNQSVNQSDLSLIKIISKSLINRSMLQSKDRELKSLIACCLVEALRFFAPTPPYDSNELVAIFDCLIDVLDCLVDCRIDCYAHCFYVLESLSLVQTPVLLVSLSSHEPLLKFVQKLIDISAAIELSINQSTDQSNNQANQVENHIVEILSGLISELSGQEMTQRLIDCFLAPLARINQSDNQSNNQTVNQRDSQTMDQRICLTVIERNKDKFERPICRFIQRYIIQPSINQSINQDDEKKKSHYDSDADSDNEHSSESSIKNEKDCEAILHSVHQYLPDCLITLTHELPDLMLIGDVERRMRFTQMFARIFCNQSINQSNNQLISQFHLTFETMINRFLDVSHSVRQTIAACSGQLLIEIYGRSTNQSINPSINQSNVQDDDDVLTSGIDSGTHQLTLEKFWSFLLIGVSDRDHAVRLATIGSLCLACESNVNLVGLSLLTELGKRCKDRNLECRKAAIHGLARCFHTHVTPYWRRGEATPSQLRRLTFVPARILEAMERDKTSAVRVEALMSFDRLLLGGRDKEVDEEEVARRTQCVVAIYATLDDTHQSITAVKDMNPNHQLSASSYGTPSPRELFRRHLISYRRNVHFVVRSFISTSARLQTATTHRLAPSKRSNKQSSDQSDNQTDDEEMNMISRQRQSSLRSLAQQLSFDEDLAAFAGVPNSHDEALRYIESILEFIITLKDERVVNSLNTLTDARSEVADIRRAVKELRTAVKEGKFEASGPVKKGKAAAVLPTPVDVCVRLSALCSMVHLPQDCVPLLFNETNVSLEAGRVALAHAAAGVAVALGHTFPVMLAQSLTSITSLLTTDFTNKTNQTTNQTIKVAALQMLASVDWNVQSSIKPPQANKLSTLLISLVTELEDEAITRHSIRALKTLLTPREESNRSIQTNLSINQPLNESSTHAESPADVALRSVFDACFSELSLASPHHRLYLAMIAVCECSVSYPQLLEENRDTFLSFVERELLPSAGPDISDVVAASAETMSRWLIALAATQSSSETLAKRAQPILRIMLHVISKQGAVNASTDLSNNRTLMDSQSSNEDDEDEELGKISINQTIKQGNSQILRSFAMCLLDICHVPLYHRLLIAPRQSSSQSSNSSAKQTFHFMTLALVAEHEDLSVSAPFVEHVYKSCETVLPAFPYLTILCLAAHRCKDEKFKLQIESWLRRLCHLARHRAAQDDAIKQTSNQDGKRMNSKLPENSLGDLIYVLSYHPDFIDPTENRSSSSLTQQDLENAFALYNRFLGYLDCFLDAVTDGANWSYLLAVCTSVKNGEDVRDPTNERIYKLADLVQLALHRRSKRKHWASTTTSVVQLPVAMYRARTTKPKDRYLHKAYNLPPEKEQASKSNTLAPPSTPRGKRSLASNESPASARTPQSARQATAPSSAQPKRRKTVEKPEKFSASPSPSRSMPSRASKTKISSASFVESDQEDNED